MSPPRPTPPPPPPSPVYVYGPFLPEQLPSEVPPTPASSYAPLPPCAVSPYPSPPDSSSTIHPSPPLSSNPQLVDSATPASLHPLLRYSQHNGPALIWDLRNDPTLSFLQQVTTSGSHTPVPEEELLQPATAPPVPILSVSCGIVPPTSTWGTITITGSPSSSRNSVRNSLTRVVTVSDVLGALRTCMLTRLTQQEWDDLPQKQRDRIESVYHARWKDSEASEETRMNGVLRQDCLLKHTVWAGLTLSLVEQDAAVLTLQRCADP